MTKNMLDRSTQRIGGQRERKAVVQWIENYIDQHWGGHDGSEGAMALQAAAYAIRKGVHLK